MGLSLWPERARQLEILVDWQPRDWKTLLMCFSRRIYNWFFVSFRSCDLQTAMNLTETYTQTCYKFVHAVVDIRLVFDNYISLDFWLTFQITAAKRTKHYTLDLNFHTTCFSSWPVVITITMENVFFFCFFCIKSFKVLSVICLFIMDREVSCLLLKKTNVNNVYFSTKRLKKHSLVNST